MQARTTASPRSPVRAALFCSLISLSCVGARAAELADCKALEDDPKRLACYDAISGRTVTTADKQMPAVVGAVRNDVSGISAVARAPVDTTVPGTKASNLSERWDLDGGPSPSLFSLRPYKPVYILPAFYSSSPNLHPTSPNASNNADLNGPIDHAEAKFQYSLKAKLLEDVGFAGSNFWLGYTQTSYWQVYNGERSRPFRESDYEPELMYTAPTHYSLAGVDGKLIGLSLTHQSNGRDNPQSRSWNRVIGQIGLESGDWTVLVRPWLRLREKASKDDNSDILNYMGRGEVIAIGKLGNSQLSVTLRHSLRVGNESHGSVRVDYAFPVYGYLKGYVQAFSGYGENLLDYNHHQNAIGLGVSLGEWF
jgi:phospholipase A1